MELRHMRYFLMLAEELSFIKAAEKLHISQPPLSRQIKELEEEIGTRLFHRNNKRVELTGAGEYFKTEISRILDSIDRICLKTKKIGDHVSGEYRIGYMSSTFSGYITDLMTHLSVNYPYVTFRLYEVPTVKQTHALEQGRLDLGILRGPVSSAELKTQLWFKDGFSVVYNKKKIRLKSEKEMSTLKKERFIFFNKQYAPEYYTSLLQICASFGFVPEVTHESNNVASILQLVKEGLGASILPTSAVKNNLHKDLGFIELKSVRQHSEVLLATPGESDSLISKDAITFLKSKHMK